MYHLAAILGYPPIKRDKLLALAVRTCYNKKDMKGSDGENMVGNLERTCIVCGVVFESKRSDARFDTQACKKKYQRNPELFTGISEEVDMVPEKAPKPFLFKTPNNRSSTGYNEDDWREGKAWYDVPIAAIPKIYQGDPEMPEWMNGREYFLWRANDFEVENDRPQILNPLPVYEKITYQPGGQASRQWGA